MLTVKGASNSPFRPGYGKQPLVFGGHQEAISEFADLFAT